jgi:hypothetical protein
VKSVFASRKSGSPVDKNLPLGLHLQGKVELDATRFTLYGDRLLTTFPGREHIIAAYGRVPFGDAVLHRFYLQGEDDAQSMLEILVDSGGGLQECRLFRTLDEIMPEDSEEWGFWLAREDGSIGWSAFQTRDGVLFDRAWDDAAANRVMPFDLSETLYLDSAGEKVLTVNHQAMLYGRWADEEDEIAEYALLSAEDQGDEAFVHIQVGVDINPMGIKVLY